MTEDKKMELARQFAKGANYETEKLNRYYVALVVLTLIDSNILT